MAKIQCAQVDERGVYQGMVEIEEAEAGPRHLTGITACDLPVGEFRWAPDESNPFGGAFLPLPRPQRAKAGRPTLEHAYAFDLLARWERKETMTDVSLAWLDDVLQSLDFLGVSGLHSVQRYAVARGLDIAKQEG